MTNFLPCPVCQKGNIQTLFVQPKRKIIQCTFCRVVFVDPQPSDQELYQIYNERYFDSEEFRGKTCIGYFAYLDERPLLLRYFKRKLNLIKKFINKGKVLDVGCGHGFFLEAAEKSGFEAMGIDISEYAVEYAQKHGLKAILTDIEKAGFKEDSFDIVTAFQLIEHVREPLNFIREAYRVLRPGGLILLTTPNQNGYLRRLMRENWLSYRHQEHIFFFSPDSINYLLKKAGFTSIKFFKDETRFYPLRHILGGVKYYFKGTSFKSLAEFWSSVFDKLKLLDLKLPLPLDTLVIVAFKPKK